MNILKIGAVIELLSTLAPDVLEAIELGHLNHDLQEVFDDCLDEWERLAGKPHPLDIEEA